MGVSTQAEIVYYRTHNLTIPLSVWGKDNKYGHPNPEAVGRLEKYSHEILSTIDHGTVSFLLDGNHVKLDIDK